MYRFPQIPTTKWIPTVLWDTVVRHRDVHRRRPQVTLCDANHNSTVYIYFSLVLINVSQKMEGLLVLTHSNYNKWMLTNLLFTLTCYTAYYIHMMCRIFLTLVCQSTYFLSPLLSSRLHCSICALYMKGNSWAGLTKGGTEEAEVLREAEHRWKGFLSVCVCMCVIRFVYMCECVLIWIQH